MRVEDFKIKIFADGADIQGMRAMAGKPWIKGFTTNPTLMRKAGITDYKKFARDVIAALPDRPISFEVFADEFAEMESQAREIATWGRNVNVKIPITNTRGESSVPLCGKLSKAGVVLNVTAIFTHAQVAALAAALDPGVPSIISVFAGRIADTGVDPIPHMRKCKSLLATQPKAELLWASPREALNLVHAEDSGCQIITMTNDLLAKVEQFGKDLGQFSLETVQMFRKDALAANYAIALAASV
ncbi:MAG: transaldolase [Proteobacteria bacterium]|nr:transaldolase [Pseudomonadota bacterium]